MVSHKTVYQGMEERNLYITKLHPSDMPKPEDLKVLVLDDKAHLRLLYETELKKAGYDVQTVSSGSQALSQYDAEMHDCVVLDIRMAGMDGIEVLQWLQDKDTVPKIILNTAYSSYRENYLTWSADAFLKKSSDVSQLVSKVDELLGVDRIVQ